MSRHCFHPERVDNLKTCIKYEQDVFKIGYVDIAGSRQIWEQTSEENHDAYVNLGCSLRTIGDIIAHGLEEYAELRIGSRLQNMELCSVGNSQVLKASKLVEAFNLKAAMEYVTRNAESARIVINDMPPRTEEELDSVTLHNHALFYMDVDPAAGFLCFDIYLMFEEP